MYSCYVLIVTKFTDFVMYGICRILKPFCPVLLNHGTEYGRKELECFVARRFSLQNISCPFLPSIFSFCAFLFIFCCAHVPLGHSGLFIQCTPTSLLPCGTCTASSYLYRLRAAWQTSRTYVVDTWISNSLLFVGLSRVSLCLITPCCVIPHEDQNH